MIINTLSAGGAETQLLRLCRAMPAGVDVTVYSYDSRGSRCELREPFEQAPIRLIVENRDEMSRVGFVWRLSRFLRRERFDVVHCWHGTANLYGVAAAVMAGCKCILTGHRNYGVPPAWYRCIDRLLEPFTTLRVVNSEAIRRKHSRTTAYPLEKLVVLYNGLDPNEFQLLPDAIEMRCSLGFDARPLIMTVGRLAPIKQQHVFVEAAARILKRGYDWQFAIVGDGPQRANLETQILELGIGGQVRLVGKRFDVPAILSCATLSVLTSESEGLPNAVLESMMAGVPVITTDNGGGPELVDNPEQVTPVGDVDALSERMISAVTKGGTLQRWSDRGRTRALECFTISAAAARYEQILRQALTPAS